MSRRYLHILPTVVDQGGCTWVHPKPFYTARPCHGKTTTTTPIFHHLPLHGQWSLSIVSPMVRSMVTAIKEFLPNGQVNGYCHQELLTGYQRFENIFCCFTTFTAIFSFICCEIIKNFELLLFSTENFVPSRFIFSYDNGHWRFSHQWSKITEGFLLNGQPNGHGHPGITFRNGPYGKAGVNVR